MIKLLIGGSPCTFWSIAQKNNRETEAEGLGWELFKNYLIAKEKFKPDFFLYENNKSAAQAIKDQISRELGVDLMYINSALVSAQSRKRFYAFNWEVGQPQDKGLVLRDVLESDVLERETSYRLSEPRCVGEIPAHKGTYRNGKQASQQYRVFDVDAKGYAVTTCAITNVAEPVRIGTIENNLKNEKHDSKQYRVYSPSGKSTTLCGQGGGVGAKTGLYATPIKVGEIGKGGQGNRIYSVDGKSVTQAATSGGIGSNQGLYAVPCNGKEKPIYEVKDGIITIKGKQYPIKLPDGFYIIRKLTPVECERLQTLPDNYTAAVSDAQRYKGLGNGWTAEVIIHILNGALKDIPRDEEIIVLSMYDGIGTGRYCLDKMGFTNVRYYAYEIDKYAKQVAMSNYPDIIQMGDAFNLRHPDWTIGY